jgi:hypothetical protein
VEGGEYMWPAVSIFYCADGIDAGLLVVAIG